VIRYQATVPKIGAEWYKGKKVGIQSLGREVKVPKDPPVQERNVGDSLGD